MSYRNVYFDRKKSIIHHWGFDQDGTPNKKEVYFKPYVYVPDLKGTPDAFGIDMQPLRKKEFDYQWERNKFVDNYQGILYFNLPPTQQYLLENYYNEDITELTKYPLRIFFYDIEVIASEFPDAQQAKYPITSITIYDTYTKKFQVWGNKKYDEYSCKDHLKGIEPDEICYNFCIGERDLLVKFLRYWRKNFPDLVVGYNSNAFDMPYIVNRLNSLFGEDTSAKLSPVNNIYGAKKENKFKQEYIEYTIGGVAQLDYMVLFKTFTPGERESDSLDFVAYDELKIGKLEYSGSLNQLMNEDWNKFINYNIWDVKLLMLLDEKKKYLDIAKFSAFSGFCNLDKAFGKTSIITGVLAKQSLQKGQIIPTQTDGEKQDIPGGYVKLPELKLFEDVVSYDANSLYPSIMITLNISPESKIGKITGKKDDILSIFLFKENKTIELHKDKLYPLLRKKNWSISGCNVIFDQTTKSVSSQFVDELYQKRKNVKERMFVVKKQMEGLDEKSTEYIKLKLLSSQLDTEQYLYKILLNSTYGAFANRFFSLYDIDCAKSITTTGQKMIKQTEKIVNQFIIDEWKVENKDYVVAMDTDSVLLTIKDICDKYNIKLVDENNNLTKEFIDVETKIADHLNKNIEIWAKEYLNSKDPRFFFKRESVCTKALWTGKKHYILNIINKEGEKMNKLKYSGLSIAKSTFSNTLKDISKNVVKIIMTEKNRNKANELIFQSYENFSQLSIKDVSERASIKVLNKWDDKNVGMDCASGTTRGAKYSIYHNELLKELHLENKYRKIENGSKIKMVFIKDNKYNIEGIAYQEEFPPEFDLTPDYERMFFKGVIKSLEPIYNAVNWKVPNPKMQYTVSLEEIFGGD